MVTECLRAGSLPNMWNNLNKTPLDKALEHNNRAVADLLSRSLINCARAKYEVRRDGFWRPSCPMNLLLVR